MRGNHYCFAKLKLAIYFLILGTSIIMIAVLRNFTVNLVLTGLLFPIFIYLTQKERFHRKIMWRLTIFMVVVFLLNTYEATGSIWFRIGNFYITKELVLDHLHLLFFFFVVFMELYTFLTSVRISILEELHQISTKNLPTWLVEIVLSFSLLTEALSISIRWKPTASSDKLLLFKRMPELLGNVFLEIRKLVSENIELIKKGDKEVNVANLRFRWAALLTQYMVLSVLIIRMFLK